MRYIIASSRKAFLQTCEEQGLNPRTNVTWVHSFAQIRDLVVYPSELILASNWADIRDNALLAKVREIKGW